MGTVKNNFVFKFGQGTIDGQAVPKMTDVTITRGATEIEARAGCDLYPWFRAETEKSWSGTITFQAINPTLLAAMMGGTAIATGYHYVKEESISPSAGSATLANTAIDGSLIITSGNGQVMYKEVAATPGVGEFTHASDTATVTFNASEGGTLEASYFYSSANAEQWSEGKSDTTPTVSLYLAGCGQNIENAADSFMTFYFPAVKFSNFNFSASNGDINTITADFTAVIPTDGSDICYVGVEDA